MTAEDGLITVAESVAAVFGWVVVDADISGRGGRQIVRVFIDKPGGVTIDDCERFSREVEPEIDRLMGEGSRYSIEVSSPGIDRILKRRRELEWGVGRKVRVTAVDDEGGTVIYRGILSRLEKDDLVVDDLAYGEVVIDGRKVRQVRLDPMDE